VKRSGSQWIAGAFSALALTAATAQTPPAQGGISLGEPKPFSFETLAKEAKALAASDYQEREIPDKDLVAKIDYLVHGKIRFKTDEALWIGSKKQFAVSLFHVGKYFSRPVQLFRRRK
jgi:glucans biosynthesis protein